MDDADLDADLATLDARLAALADRGSDVGPIHAQLPAVHELRKQGKMIEAVDLCRQLLGLAGRMAHGRAGTREVRRLAVSAAASHFDDDHQELQTRIRDELQELVVEGGLDGDKATALTSRLMRAVDEEMTGRTRRPPAGDPIRALTDKVGELVARIERLEAVAGDDDRRPITVSAFYGQDSRIDWPGESTTRQTSKRKPGRGDSTFRTPPIVGPRREPTEAKEERGSGEATSPALTDAESRSHPLIDSGDPRSRSGTMQATPPQGSGDMREELLRRLPELLDDEEVRKRIKDLLRD